ncbi:hypothetical protein Hanom_Chr14g01270951 [Helianthus anomalus]
MVSGDRNLGRAAFGSGKGCTLRSFVVFIAAYKVNYILYISMKPIKSNCLPNHPPPYDLDEIKSWPFKLHFLTSIVAVISGYWMVSWPSPLSRDSRYHHIGYSSPIKPPLCSIGRFCSRIVQM